MTGRHRQGDMRARNGTGAQVRGGGGLPRGGAVIPKVPGVNTHFWTVKILTTAMGEAVSDFLVRQFNPYLAVVAGFAVFAIAISWQLRVPAYKTWPYWSAVAMVAVFGTMVADAMHVGLGIPYEVSVILFAVALAAVLAAWYRVEHTLSIHSITTPRREFFYWATVICTFALGTATGDLTATTLRLGYLTSGVVFTLAICVPLAAWRLGVNPVLTFWVAYILTRPIGASFADYFGMPKSSGALGIGHGPVSLVTLVLVAAGIWYLSVTRKDAPSPAAVPARVPAAVPARVPAGAPAGRFAPAGAGIGPAAGGRPEWDGRQGREPRGRQGREPQRRPAPEYYQGWEPPGRPEPEYDRQPGRDPRYPQYPDSPDSSPWPR